MKGNLGRLSRGLLGLCLPLLVGTAASQQATLFADAHVTSVHADANYGSLSNLYVGNGATALLQFNLDTLPSGITSAQIARATLRVYANRVDVAGAVSVQVLGRSWAELSATYNTMPAMGAAVATMQVSAANSFYTADVTALVQGWVNGTAVNYGVALTSASGQIVFDSKENDETAHPAVLEITYAVGVKGDKGDKGDTGPQGPAGPMGATGATGAQGPQGIAGATGATGTQGPKGDKGDTGAAGADGLAGARFQGAYASTTNYALNDVVTWQSAAWISITASNHGNTPSESPAWWGVLVPAAVGEKGDKGDTGETGPQGPQGYRGYTGDTGATGAQGPTGATGRPGFVYQGSYQSTVNYVAGDVVLWNGGSWASLVDYNVGQTPDASPTYWGALTSRGLQGEKGDTGPQGLQGIQGPQGMTGAQGDRGLPGETGPPGAQGPQGIQGFQGEQGLQGLKGDRGDAGAPGIAWQGTYASTKNYDLHDSVAWNGQTWLSIAESNHGNTPDQSPAWWTLLAAQGGVGATGPQGATGATGATGPQGPQGIQGVTGATGATGPQGEAGGNWKGAYASSTNYALHDIVTWNGVAYISVVAGNVGNTPGASGITQWDVMVPAGATGAQGPQGIQGPVGATGPQGFTGPQGIPGNDGATGSQGPQGTTGPQGAQGEKGDKGDKGDTGVQGPAGFVWRGTYSSTTTYSANDAVNYNGASYVSLASPNVGQTPDVATAWWAVLSARGATGATGAAGANGTDGAAASVQVGSVVTGAAGANAQVQNVGTAQTAVLNFVVPRGADGAAGKAGLTWRGAWSAGYGYVAGDAVSYDGASYIALAASTNSNPATDVSGGAGNWSVLAAQGSTGANGAATVTIGSVTSGPAAAVTNSGSNTAAVLNFTLPRGDTGATGAAGLTWRGAWSAATEYSASDAVTRSGSSYVALVASTGVDPATDTSGVRWSVLASQGSQGSTGATGQTGPTGAAATVSVGSTTTLAAGQTPYVVNDGTTSAAVLHFYLPQGANGSGTSAGALISSVHTVAAATGGLSTVSYHNPFADTKGSSEIYSVLGYMGTACNVNTVSVYNSATTDVKLDFRTGTPGSMTNDASLQCTVSAGSSKACTGPGALTAGTFLDWKVTTTSTAQFYLWASFVCAP